MITDPNTVEAMGSRFSRRLYPFRHSTTRNLWIGRDVSAGPPTGYIAVLIDNLPKKRFPKSPLLRNNSCMRAELNATQSPLTISKFAMHERAGSLRGIAASSGSSFQLGKKKPPSRRGLHSYGVVALGLIKDRGILQECHPSCCFPSFGR